MGLKLSELRGGWVLRSDSSSFKAKIKSQHFGAVLARRGIGGAIEDLSLQLGGLDFVG
jgi:hypothetical protein